MEIGFGLKDRTPSLKQWRWQKADTEINISQVLGQWRCDMADEKSEKKQTIAEIRHEEMMIGLKAVSDRISEMVGLQKIANFEQPNTIRFPFDGEEIQLYIPYATFDFIQRNIVRSNNFFEHRELELLRQRIDIKAKPIIYDIGANIGNHTVYFLSLIHI